MSLLLKSLRLAGSSRFTHATSLGVWIVSDFPLVIWTMTGSMQWKDGLQLAQNCPDYQMTTVFWWLHFIKHVRTSTITIILHWNGGVKMVESQESHVFQVTLQTPTVQPDVMTVWHSPNNFKCFQQLQSQNCFSQQSQLHKHFTFCKCHLSPCQFPVLTSTSEFLLLYKGNNKLPHIIVQRKTNLMHNLFLVHFVNLYMFRAYLGPSSGGTTVCVQKLVLIILFRWLSIVLFGLDNRQSSKKNNKYQFLYTHGCASWWWA
jgi:hypothetical protein